MDVDRHVVAGSTAFQPTPGTDYMERNCIVGEPRRLCIYDRVKGKILKTVDSVYQAIDSREDCEDLCNSAPFRCHSYDYNDTGDFVCRLSHHSAHTLTQIEEPYLAIEEATTYELSACYNVSIDCHSGDMVANIVTSTLFDGKVYAKGSPLTCVEDIESTVRKKLHLKKKAKKYHMISSFCSSTSTLLLVTMTLTVALKGKDLESIAMKLLSNIMIALLLPLIWACLSLASMI